MKTIYLKLTQRLEDLKDLPLLFLRLVLAYGFFGPALMKLNDLDGIADWFRTLGIPAPVLNAWLSAGTELLGSILLVVGFATRIIALPLMVTMLVAIRTVHWANGFEAAENGYEIPLYYLLMLLLLFFTGPGKLSLDYLIRRRMKIDN